MKCPLSWQNKLSKPVFPNQFVPCTFIPTWRHGAEQWTLHISVYEIFTPRQSGFNSILRREHGSLLTKWYTKIYPKYINLIPTRISCSGTLRSGHISKGGKRIIDWSLFVSSLYLVLLYSSFGRLTATLTVVSSLPSKNGKSSQPERSSSTAASLPNLQIKVVHSDWVQHPLPKEKGPSSLP